MHHLHRAFFLKKPDRISHISMLLILTLLFILFSNSSVTFNVTLELYVPGGGKESRTPDPLLARQVLSQLSYTPTSSQTSLCSSLAFAKLSPASLRLLFPKKRIAFFGRPSARSYDLALDLAKFKLDSGGLKWTRTTDLTLIRRVL